MSPADMPAEDLVRRTSAAPIRTSGEHGSETSDGAQSNAEIEEIPMGSAINRGLTFRMAQTPVQHYLPKLLERIEKGEIDPSFVITHRATLEQGPELYKTFRDKKDNCIKVVMKP